MPRIELVIRAPNWVGDVVMATPVLEAALAAPHVARLHVLVRSHLAPILEDGPWADRVVPLAGGSRSEIETLRRLRPDAALLLGNSLGAAWRAWRAGVPIRAGSALSGRRPLLTHAVRPPVRDGRRAPIPTAHLQRDAAALLGIHPASLEPRLFVRDEIRERERERLAARGLAARDGYALCCPGAAFGPAKLWPPERFAAALDGIHERRGWRAVVSGAPGEEGVVEAVARACRHPAISLAGEAPSGLDGLKALVRASRFLLVGDSGPRWLAAAFGVPCATIMGPNFPELTATSLERAEVVRVEGLECSPCLQRRCPLEHHRCMAELEPERALAAFDRLVPPAEAGEGRA